MAYSKDRLIRRVRGVLEDNPFVDVCTEAMDTTENGLDVADTTKYDVGDLVEFQDDGEVCLVTALASATTLTVVRNYNPQDGSTQGTGTSHSINATIAKNPVFQRRAVEEAIEAAIYDLWPFVYKPVTVTLTVTSTSGPWYELDDTGSGDATEIVDLSSVVQAVTDSNGVTHYKEYGLRHDAHRVAMVENLGAGSGKFLHIPQHWGRLTNIRVNGIGKITPTLATTNYADLSAGIGVECVEAYAIARLVAETGIYRVTQEDIAMSDENVRPMIREQVAEYWERKARIKRDLWRIQLERTYPRMDPRRYRR